MIARMRTWHSEYKVLSHCLMQQEAVGGSKHRAQSPPVQLSPRSHTDMATPQAVTGPSGIAESGGEPAQTPIPGGLPGNCQVLAAQRGREPPSI